MGTGFLFYGYGSDNLVGKEGIGSMACTYGITTLGTVGYEISNNFYYKTSKGSMKSPCYLNVFGDSCVEISFLFDYFNGGCKIGVFYYLIF